MFLKNYLVLDRTRASLRSSVSASLLPETLAEGKTRNGTPTMEVTIPTGSVAPSDISLEMIDAASVERASDHGSIRYSAKAFDRHPKAAWRSEAMAAKTCQRPRTDKCYGRSDQNGKLTVKTNILNWSVLMPSPRALSVPSLSAVSFHE